MGEVVMKLFRYLYMKKLKHSLVIFFLLALPFTASGKLTQIQSCDQQMKELNKKTWIPLKKGKLRTRLTGQFRSQAQNILKADKPHPKEKSYSTNKYYKLLYQTKDKEKLELYVTKDGALIAYRYSTRVKKKRKWNNKCYLKNLEAL